MFEKILSSSFFLVLKQCIHGLPVQTIVNFGYPG